MWGQRCETEFPDETSAIKWLGTCYNKGWLQPSELTKNNGIIILYDEDELVKLVSH